MLHYKIDDTNPQQIILTPNSTHGVLGAVFLTIGIFCLLIGLLLFAGNPPHTSSQVFSGFGLFFWGASRLIKRNTELQPARAIFDNANQRLSISHKIGGKLTEGATIAYSELHDFHKTKRQVGESNISSCLALRFKDGNSWIVRYYGSNEDELRSDRDKLNGLIRFDRTGETATAFTLPQKIRVNENQGVKTYVWSFDFLSLRNIGGLLAIFGFFWAAFALVFSMDFIGGWIMTVLLGLFAGLILFLLYRWVGASAVLEIDSSELRYFEKRGLRKKLKHKLGRNELARIVFNPDFSGLQQAMFFLKQEDIKMMKNMDEGEIELGDLFSIIAFLKNSFKVYVPTLNFSERLLLARHVQSKS